MPCPSSTLHQLKARGVQASGTIMETLEANGRFLACISQYEETGAPTKVRKSNPIPSTHSLRKLEVGGCVMRGDARARGIAVGSRLVWHRVWRAKSIAVPVTQGPPRPSVPQNGGSLLTKVGSFSLETLDEGGGP
jgi:hypothetical protein